MVNLKNMPFLVLVLYNVVHDIEKLEIDPPKHLNLTHS